MCRYSYILFFLLTSSGAYGFTTSTTSPRNNLQRINGFTSKTVTQKPAARTHDFALNAILEAGIDPLTTTAIFAAAFFILSAGQTEIITTEDIKMGKERLKDLANAEKNTEIDKALEKMDLIDDSVKSAMEEMITSFQNSPIQSRSRPSAISFDSEISSLKRRVASTLKSEMAMQERLGKENEELMQEILMEQPGPQKPILKPKVVEPILAAFLEEEVEEEEEKVTKSSVVARIVKKLVMPWKKFSTLS